MIAGQECPAYVFDISIMMFKLLLKIGVLTGLKESYLTARNLLGLLFHPFKTIYVIREEKDKSQTILIFGMPVYGWIGGLVLIAGLRWLTGRGGLAWGWLAKSLGVMLSLGVVILAGYLGYWGMRVIKLKIKYQISNIKMT